MKYVEARYVSGKCGSTKKIQITYNFQTMICSAIRSYRYSETDTNPLSINKMTFFTKINYAIHVPSDYFRKAF